MNNPLRGSKCKSVIEIDKQFNPIWLIEFAECLFPFKQSDYDPDRAKSIIKPNYPKSIFKYRTLTKESLRSLNEDTVWLADPQYFNDPYECAVSADIEDVFRERSLLIPEEMSSMLRENGLSDNAILEFFADVANEIGYKKSFLKAFSTCHPEHIANRAVNDITEAIRRTLEMVFKKFKSTMRVCSFTTRQDNMLMWSHYANSHKGFCLEYDVEEMLDFDELNKSNLMPIIYSDCRFNVNYFAIHADITKDFYKGSINLGTLVKSSAWAYEKEWRLSIHTDLIPTSKGAHGILHKMPKPMALYLGSKIQKEDEISLREICKNRNIQVYRVFEDSKAYVMNWMND